MQRSTICVDRMLVRGFCSREQNFHYVGLHKRIRSNFKRQQNFFNEKMKPVRARVEHCIGFLKNHFQLLKSLHFVLDEEKESMAKMIRCTTAYITVHNFLITKNDEGNNVFAEEYGHANDADSDNELNCPVDDAAGERAKK